MQVVHTSRQRHAPTGKHSFLSIHTARFLSLAVSDWLLWIRAYHNQRRIFCRVLSYVNRPLELVISRTCFNMWQDILHKEDKVIIKVGSVLVGLTILRRAQYESEIKVVIGYGKPQQLEIGTITTTCSVWAKITAWHTKICCQGYHKWIRICMYFKPYASKCPT